MKKGTGRGRLKVSLSVVFRMAAPNIVIAKSQASRRHLRFINQINIRTVAVARKSVDPVKEIPRIVSVRTGEANWWTAARVKSSN